MAKSIKGMLGKFRFRSQAEVAAIWKASGLEHSMIKCIEGMSVPTGGGEICVPEGGLKLPLSLFISTNDDECLKHATRMRDMEFLVSQITDMDAATITTYQNPNHDTQSKANLDEDGIVENTVTTREEYVMSLQAAPDNSHICAVLHGQLPESSYSGKTTMKTINGVPSLTRNPFIPVNSWGLPFSELNGKKDKRMVEFFLPVGGDSVVISDADALKGAFADGVSPLNLLSRHGPCVGSFDMARQGQGAVHCNFMATAGLSGYVTRIQGGVEEKKTEFNGQHTTDSATLASLGDCTTPALTPGADSAPGSGGATDVYLLYGEIATSGTSVKVPDSVETSLPGKVQAFEAVDKKESPVCVLK